MEGKPVQWAKIHDLPDYSYFNHQAHTTKAIGCVTCHGRVDRMEEVFQEKPLNMAWCLDCHRSPEKFLRPADEVTNMSWNVAEIIANLSTMVKLEAGDLIYTGTPAGVGPLLAGDQLEAGVAGVGTLSARIV